jgi:SpoVK/Ycf46/Vps4 family AAA+-type ATPase
MKQDISNWTLIFDIVRAGLTKRADDVARTAQELAERIEHPLSGAGEPQIAKRLRRLVAEAPQFSTTAGGVTDARMPPTMGGNAGAYVAISGGSGPVDSESRSPFVDEQAVLPIEQPVLPEAVTAELERFVELQQYRDDLLRAGLPAPRALLLYGAPGCGKTTAARYVASSLRLPLLTVRLDAVISSYLGTTAKNLRTVFDYAAQRHGVLFLDEFDALAKMRDDANEIGEIKRIVNGLIQNLDLYPDMPLIAATNHEHLLDPAIWRRFDSVIGLPLPGENEREALLRLFAERVYRPAFVDKSDEVSEASKQDEASNAPKRMLRAASLSVLPHLQQPQKEPARARQRHARPDRVSPLNDLENLVSPDQLDHEELAVLAQVTETCSGADLERFVIRARQEVLLSHLHARAHHFKPREQGSAPVGIPGGFALQLLLEIWRERGRLGESDERQSAAEQASGALRSALVHFIDRRTRERPSARVVSALTGIPASTVARMRQQRDHGLPEDSQLGEDDETL